MSNWVADFAEREAVGEVVMRAKHGIHTRQPNGELRSDFTGSPCHYLDTDGLYKPLDTKLIYDPISGMYGAPGLQPRIADYRLVEAGSHAHLTAWVGVFNPTLMTFSEMDTLTSGLTDDDCLISETGIFRGVLRLTETGMRDELVIQSNPNVGANTDEWFVIESLIDGISFVEGEEVFEFENAGYRFPLPKAWDANGNQAVCKRWASTRNGMQSLYTGVPAEWLETAAYPVTIDPDFAESTADGYVAGYSSNYSSARSSAYSKDTNSDYLIVGDRQLTYYDIWRSFLKFDTSSIPDSNNIAQVNLNMTCCSDSSTTDFNVVIRKQNWSAYDPLTTGWTSAYTACLSAASDESIWRNTSGIELNTQYASGNLSTAWVSKTGTTYYSLISDRDLANTGPVGYVIFNSQEAATVAYRPVLTVLSSSANIGNFFLTW